MFQSLALSDIVEIVLICAVIFSFLAIFIYKNFYKVVFVYKVASKISSNLIDCGSFRKFISESNEKNKEK